MSARLTRPLALVIVLPLLLGVPSLARAQAAQSEEQPACLTRCIQMQADGITKRGVNKFACALRLCQEEARVHYGNNKFDDALARLDQVKGMAQRSASYHLEKGLIFYALDRFDDAVASFDVVIAGFPQSVRAAAQRAHALIRLGRIPEARSQFNAILGFEDANDEIKHLRTRSYVIGNLGALRLAEGDLNGAKGDLQKAIKSDGRNRLATTYLKRVVPEIEARTFGPEGVLQLQVVWEELEFDRANSAVKKLGEMLKRWPDFKLGYVVAADAQRRYGNLHACESTLRAAVTRFPDDLNIQAERIRCTLMRKGVHSMAALPDIDELKALAKRDPDDPLVKEMLELIYE